MAGINVVRWLAGGAAAGAIIWLLEGAASVLYMDDMEATLAAAGLSMDRTPTMWALTVLVSLLTGFVLVFFYAASRPRFGPGPKTAAIVATALWAGGMVVSIIGYHMIGLYPTRMLAMWGAIGLVEWNIATFVGGWIYREAAVGS